jgi:ABC-type sugar transport system ATPase subunit
VKCWDTGLQGSGRTEMAQAIFGGPFKTGSVELMEKQSL